ncbi:MAG: hypothetical protein ABJ382_03500, partial [Ilumatobacter sp.]
MIVAAAMTAAYVVAPAEDALEPIRVVSPVIAIGAVLFGIASHRPQRRLPWIFLTIAFGFLVAAHTVWSALVNRENVTFPTLADGLHVGFWVAALIAMVELSRQSESEHDAFGGYEIGIIAIAVGVGVWLVVAEPYFSDGDLDRSATAWAAAAPLIGGLAFAASVRSAAARHFRSFSPVVLMLGIALQLIADVIRGTQEIRDQFGSGGVIGGLGVAAPLVIASAALDRSMAPENGPTSPSSALSVGRTIGLTVAVLAPLTVLLALVVSDLGSGTTILVVA